jgi:phosphoribosylformylglycinamidine (FGAM) synthase-like amidotransferase family enzyme
MKAAVITFPGSNCDRDLAPWRWRRRGAEVARVWHKDDALPAGTDLVGCRAAFPLATICAAAPLPRIRPSRGRARPCARGGYVLGICNGFQVLTELGLLPGALMRNAGLTFICRRWAAGRDHRQRLTSGLCRRAGDPVPVAHHDGNYQIDAEGLAALKDQDRIAFTYAARSTARSRISPACCRKTAGCWG